MSYRQNYLEKVELRKQCRLASGLISEQFPEVSGIVIRMTYYRKAASNYYKIQQSIKFKPLKNNK